MQYWNKMNFCFIEQQNTEFCEIKIFLALSVINFDCWAIAETKTTDKNILVTSLSLSIPK